MLYYDGSTSCVATSVYNDEIKAGDFVIWEVTLNGEAASTKLSLQPIITFREIEQESSTHKWVSGAGGPKTDMMDEEDGHETTLDVTLPCQSTTTSPIKALLLCPLVFFSGLNREKVIAGHAKAVIFVGPLAPGEYPFFGEFNPKTAQGVIRVTAP